MHGGGDPSYGMYLWGWPLTQMLRGLVAPDWNGYALAALAIPASLLAGYASWFLIERPVLRLIDRRRARRSLVAS